MFPIAPHRPMVVHTARAPWCGPANPRAARAPLLRAPLALHRGRARRPYRTLPHYPGGAMLGRRTSRLAPPCLSAVRGLASRAPSPCLRRARAASSVVPLDGVRGHPRSMSSVPLVPPPPRASLTGRHRPWGLPTLPHRAAGQWKKISVFATIVFHSNSIPLAP